LPDYYRGYCATATAVESFTRQLAIPNVAASNDFCT